MEKMRDVILDMQESGKIPRNLKNPAERAFFQQFVAQGWYVTKRGWPDFACFKGDNLALVEVKRSSRRRLKKEQQLLIQALVKLRVKCFSWSPDGGLKPLYQAK